MFSAQAKEAANSSLSDSKNAAYSAKRDFDSTLEGTGSEFEVAARKVGKQVRGFVENASDQITDVSDKVTGEIRTNPVRSSAIALGIGFILGALLHNRS